MHKHLQTADNLALSTEEIVPHTLVDQPWFLQQ